MRIVVIGPGGREHALVWRLSREGNEVIAIPGNPGAAAHGTVVGVPLNDLDAVESACVEAKPQLVVIGPEAPLAAGLSDRLRARGLSVFGPSAKAARIESSKSYAKEIMQRGKVPTADFALVETTEQLDEALARMGGQVAVKADGLAAGKGVVVCDSVDEAREHATRFLERGPVVIEERLSGPELSVIAITDGKGLAILPSARDHKRLLDNDEGPNTGGMGAVCPVPVEDGLLDSLRDTVFRPTLEALAADGAPFTGALYAGLMLDPRGLRVLEFNARFGDPETQAILVALSNGVKLGEVLLAAAEGRLEDADLTTDGAACCVVMASEGYPEAPRTGDVIQGLDSAQETGAIVFHAGTAERNGEIVTAGGRVLGVTARGADLESARIAAQAACDLIRFPGAQRRLDIGLAPSGSPSEGVATGQ